MLREYIEKREGGYFVAGSRVSLESIIFMFLDGAAPESITKSFPSLSLEQVYGAITFYLANKVELDAYLAGIESLWKSARAKQGAPSADLQERLVKAHQEISL